MNRSSMSSAIDRIEKALRDRQDLLDGKDTNACRLFNGQADGIAGLVIEKLGDVLIVQIHQGQLRPKLDRVRTIAEYARERLGARAVYRKTFVRNRAAVPEAIEAEHHDATPWIGEPVEPELVITEHGLRFIVRPYDGFSVGLFLEHREDRRWIRELAAGRHVLNGFAYTCGFSVAAAAGGAASVHSVDSSARFLEWGKCNFAANNLSIEPHLFFRSDVFDFYHRAGRQQRRYDLVILDPPTFSRQRRPQRAFALAEQLPALVAGAIDLLAPSGLVLLATNDRQIPQSRLEDQLAAAARSKGRDCTIAERPALPIDFAGDAEYAKAVLAQLT